MQYWNPTNRIPPLNKKTVELLRSITSRHDDSNRRILEPRLSRIHSYILKKIDAIIAMEMPKHLTKRNMISLVKAIHTGHVPTIVQAILSVDQLYLYLMNKLLTPPTNTDSNSLIATTLPVDNITSFGKLPCVPVDPLAWHFQQNSVEQLDHLKHPRYNISLTLDKRGHHNYNYLDEEVIDLSINKNSSKDLLEQRLQECIQVSEDSSSYSEPNRDPLVPINLSSKKQTDQERIDNLSINEGFKGMTYDKKRQLEPNRMADNRIRNGVSDTSAGGTMKIYPSKRPKKCSICSKIVRADNLRVHLRSHTGEKPYHCPICPFRTANPSSMPKHLRLHDRGRQVYSCPRCPYKTIYKSNINAHLRIHRSLL